MTSIWDSLPDAPQKTKSTIWDSLPDAPSQEKKSFLVEAPQSIPETVLHSGINGLMAGTADEAKGLFLGVPRGIKDYATQKDTTSPNLMAAASRGYEDVRNVERGIQDKGERDNPYAAAGSNIGGNILGSIALPASKLPALMASGATSGFGYSKESDPAKVATDTALGMGLATIIPGARGLAKLPFIDSIKTNMALKSLGGQKSNLKSTDPSFKKKMANYALDNDILSANPTKSLADQQATVARLQQKVGNNLNQTRETLPAAELSNVLKAVQSQQKFNPDEEISKALKQQLDAVFSDLQSKAVNGKINAKDLLDYKSSLYNLARKSNGEVNPTKDVLEHSRKGISQVEKELAQNSNYSNDLTDYAILKKIESLQQNKEAMKSNSVLGLGGLAGGGTAALAISQGHPGVAAMGLLGLPIVRNAINETSAKGIQTLQNIRKSSNIDPRILSYLLSQKGENN